jgi:molecular chaperone GrpE (heat shock protein)
MDCDNKVHQESAWRAAELASPAALIESVNDLRASVDELASAVGGDHDRAAHREVVISRLHAENQQLRRGELEALVAPLRGGLFAIHDRARRAAGQCRAASELTPEQAAALLEVVAEEVVDVLARAGVERIETAVGEEYDPTRHRPVATVPVAEASQHRTIVAVRGAGFAADGKPVRKADVVVAQHQPAAPDPTEPGDRDDCPRD